jgi:hypothetical protein
MYYGLFGLIVMRSSDGLPFEYEFVYEVKFLSFLSDEL